MVIFQAGQATEPECLVAVELAAGDDGQVGAVQNLLKAYEITVICGFSTRHFSGKFSICIIVFQF